MANMTARVRVTLEINVPGAWGDDCQLSQVYKQAADEAINILRGYFSLGDCLQAGAQVMGKARAQIMRTPVVLAVTTEGKP